MYEVNLYNSHAWIKFVLSISEQYESDNYSGIVNRFSDAMKAAGISEEFTGMDKGELIVTFESQDHFTEFMLRWS